MHRLLKTCLQKLPMEKFTGRYSFRPENRPGVLPDTTIAGPDVRRVSGDRHGAHDGRFCKPAGRGLSGWHSCSGEATGSVRKWRRGYDPFQILPGYGRQRRSGFYVPGSFSSLPTATGCRCAGKHSVWSRYCLPARPGPASEKGNRRGFETTA